MLIDIYAKAKSNKNKKTNTLYIATWTESPKLALPPLFLV